MAGAASLSGKPAGFMLTVVTAYLSWSLLYEALWLSGDSEIIDADGGWGVAVAGHASPPGGSSIRASAALGTRKLRPKARTDKPLRPPVARHWRHSS